MHYGSLASSGLALSRRGVLGIAACAFSECRANPALHALDQFRVIPKAIWVWDASSGETLTN
jgi:hypothetical protein